MGVVTEQYSYAIINYFKRVNNRYKSNFSDICNYFDASDRTEEVKPGLY